MWWYQRVYDDAVEARAQGIRNRSTVRGQIIDVLKTLPFAAVWVGLMWLWHGFDEPWFWFAMFFFCAIKGAANEDYRNFEGDISEKEKDFMLGCGFLWVIAVGGPCMGRGLYLMATGG